MELSHNNLLISLIDDSSDQKLVVDYQKEQTKRNIAKIISENKIIIHNKQQQKQQQKTIIINEETFINSDIYNYQTINNRTNLNYGSDLSGNSFDQQKNLNIYITPHTHTQKTPPPSNSTTTANDLVSRESIPPQQPPISTGIPVFPSPPQIRPLHTQFKNKHKQQSIPDPPPLPPLSPLPPTHPISHQSIITTTPIKNLFFKCFKNTPFKSNNKCIISKNQNIIYNFTTIITKKSTTPKVETPQTLATTTTQATFKNQSHSSNSTSSSITSNPFHYKSIDRRSLSLTSTTSNNSSNNSSSTTSNTNNNNNFIKSNNLFKYIIQSSFINIKNIVKNTKNTQPSSPTTALNQIIINNNNSASEQERKNSILNYNKMLFNLIDSNTTRPKSIKMYDKYNYDKTGYKVSSEAIQSVYLKFNKRFYCGGQAVTGELHVTINRDIQATGINLNWKSSEHVLIQHITTTTDENDPTCEYEEPPNQHVNLIQQKKILYKTTEQIYQTDESGTIYEGTHIFPFSFLVPSHLPSSFCDVAFDKVCNDKIISAIVYSCTVSLDSPEERFKIKKGFVISEPSIIAASVNEIPLQKEKKKTFLTSTGMFSIKASVKRNVFYPGESIPIKIKIDNSTNKNIKYMTICLKKVENVNIHCENYHLQKKCSSRITQKYLGVNAHSSLDEVLNFSTEQIKSSTPTVNGSLITCQYKLIISCFVKRALDVVIRFNVLIGFDPNSSKSLLGIYEEYDGYCNLFNKIELTTDN